MVSMGADQLRQPTPHARPSMCHLAPAPTELRIIAKGCQALARATLEPHPTPHARPSMPPGARHSAAALASAPQSPPGAQLLLPSASEKWSTSQPAASVLAAPIFNRLPPATPPHQPPPLFHATPHHTSPNGAASYSPGPPSLGEVPLGKPSTPPGKQTHDSAPPHAHQQRLQDAPPPNAPTPFRALGRPLTVSAASLTILP